MSGQPDLRKDTSASLHGQQSPAAADVNHELEVRIRNPSIIPFSFQLPSGLAPHLPDPLPHAPPSLRPLHFCLCVLCSLLLLALSVSVSVFVSCLVLPQDATALALFGSRLPYWRLATVLRAASYSGCIAPPSVSVSTARYTTATYLSSWSEHSPVSAGPTWLQ